LKEWHQCSILCSSLPKPKYKRGGEKQVHGATSILKRNLDARDNRNEMGSGVEGNDKDRLDFGELRTHLEECWRLI